MVYITPPPYAPPSNHRRPCPNCGYCPHCGRGGGRPTRGSDVVFRDGNSTDSSDLDLNDRAVQQTVEEVTHG